MGEHLRGGDNGAPAADGERGTGVRKTKDTTEMRKGPWERQGQLGEGEEVAGTDQNKHCHWFLIPPSSKLILGWPQTQPH